MKLKTAEQIRPIRRNDVESDCEPDPNKPIVFDDETYRVRAESSSNVVSALRSELNGVDIIGIDFERGDLVAPLIP